MTKDEALKLALEALNDLSAWNDGEVGGHMDEPYSAEVARRTITAIKEALAKPEQKPIAWVYPEGLEALKAGKPWTAYGTRQEPNNTALYLSPQPDIAPYAWVTFTPYGDEDDVWYENPEGQLLEGWTYKPLYDTTPPQRTWVGLSDEEIKAFDTWHDNREEEVGWCNPSEIVAYIEAKLKEKNT